MFYYRCCVDYWLALICFSIEQFEMELLVRNQAKLLGDSDDMNVWADRQSGNLEARGIKWKVHGLFTAVGTIH